MQITDFISQVKLIGLDSVMLIYLIEQNKSYYKRIHAIAAHITQGDIQAICSSLVVTEVLIHPFRNADQHLISQYEMILRHSRNIQLISLTPDIAHLSAQLRAKYNLKTPDAIHVATAIHSGCDTFLTNDLGIRRVQEINIAILDELEIDTSP